MAELRVELGDARSALFFERLPLLLSGLMRRLLSLNLLLKLRSQGARRADLTRSIRHLICEAVDLRVQIGDGRLVGVELIALLGDLFLRVVEVSFERLLCRLLLFFERLSCAALLFAGLALLGDQLAARLLGELELPAELGDLGVPALTLNPRFDRGLLKVTADLS